MKNLIFFINNHFILSFIWLFLFVIVSFLMIKSIFFKSKIVGNIEAIKLINQNNAVVIDTRSSELFQSGHIVNSLNVPSKNIFSGKIQELEKYKHFPIILVLNEMYEHNRYIKELLKYGFNNIYILRNGMHHWNLDHLPLITRNK